MGTTISAATSVDSSSFDYISLNMRNRVRSGEAKTQQAAVDTTDPAYIALMSSPLWVSAEPKEWAFANKK